MSFYQASELFLRTNMEVFTVQDMQAFLKKQKIKASLEDILTYIATGDLCFSLINEKFITRAGAFTNKWFSFKPTRDEVKAGVFVPGHRLMPFLDPSIHPSHAEIIFNGNQVEKKEVELTMNSILDLYALFGEGYTVPMILEDPACDTFSFSQVQYGLPHKAIQTGWTLEPFFENGFEFGDRLLCRITDWDNSLIEIKIKKEKHTSLKISFSDMIQEEWYTDFEESMLRQIDHYGPCKSIQQQLSLLFLEEQGKLCTENCGAVEDFLLHTTKIGFSAYGIESRIWRNGETVPYCGEWNRAILEFAPFPAITMLSSEFVINSYIKEMLQKQETLESPEDLFKVLYPKELIFEDDEEKLVLLHLKNRIDIVKKEYNRFNDFPVSKGRHTIMVFFKRIMALTAKLCTSEVKIDQLPQQELIMFQQMADHTAGFLEEIEYFPNHAEFEMNDMITSLNGMADAYDAIEDILLASIRNNKNNKK